MRVVLVDDSALIRSIIKQIFQADPDIQVIGEAANGQSAVEKTASLKPDLVIMDINMPVLDGIQACRQIMTSTPTPVIIFSSLLDPGDSFAAFKAGAVDVIKKPEIGDLNNPDFYGSFKEFLLSAGRRKGVPAGTKEQKMPEPGAAGKNKIKLVVIGASTGGPKAVKEILSAIPADFHLPIALVQHLEAGYEDEYVRWIGESSELNVQIARPKQHMQPGNVYVSPVDYHIKIDGASLVYDDGPKVLNQKPAVDVLFSSAAAYGRSVLGVLLTGMGRDGARGCSDIVKNGGITIVQDEATSVIFGMPKAAIEIGAATYIVGLNKISKSIINVVGD